MAREVSLSHCNLRGPRGFQAAAPADPSAFRSQSRPITAQCSIVCPGEHAHGGARPRPPGELPVKLPVGETPRRAIRTAGALGPESVSSCGRLASGQSCSRRAGKRTLTACCFVASSPSAWLNRPSEVSLLVMASLRVIGVAGGLAAVGWYVYRQRSGPLKNQAFVFVKPNADTHAVNSLVRDKLKAKGIKIRGEGEFTSDVIDEKKLIDQHYYSIASKATILKPAEMNVPAVKFKEAFGVEWKDVLANKQARFASDSKPRFSSL